MEALPTGRATSSVEAAKGVAHYHAIFGKAFIISQAKVQARCRIAESW